MATEAPPPPAQNPPAGNTTPTGAQSTPPKKGASRFNRDQFVDSNANPLETNNTLTNLRYPLDVGRNEEYPHYVVFYPLVREKSKYGTAALSGGGFIFDQTDQNRADPENNVAAVATAGAVAGFTAGAASGLGGLLKSNGGNAVNSKDASPISPVKSIGAKIGSLFKTGLAGVGGAAIGGAGGALAAGLAGEQRLVFGDSEIVLHVTERVTSGYSANWETADLGGLVGAVASGKMSAGSLFTKGGEFDAGAALNSGGELADYAARKLGKVAGIAGFDNINAAIEATSKKVENPYKEQLFRSMGFRKFGFDYRFSPRNEEEALEVFGRKGVNAEKDGIIATFLRHMHPTRSQNALFLSFPSEFLIIYYHMGEENEFVRKISNCALTDIVVDYGAEGFTTFSNGCPTEATIRMQFTELETLTAERIEKGF